MTVVRTRWTVGTAPGKASVRYMIHRPDQAGHRGHRELWTEAGVLDKDGAYALLDAEARGAVVYKVVVAPSDSEDQARDLDLRELTRQAMAEIGQRVGQPVRWVATQHDNHSEHRHVHAIAILPRKLDKPELVAVIGGTTREAQAQRAERDAERSQSHERAGEQLWTQELSL